MFPSDRQVAYVLLTSPPLTAPKVNFRLSPFDLHVLCAPPAFILSQDQTLLLISVSFETLLIKFFLTLLNFYFLIFFWFTFWYIFISENHRLVFSLKDLLFTFQCTFLFCSLVVNETYFSIPFSYCQYFFKKYFKYFFVRFLGKIKN